MTRVCSSSVLAWLVITLIGCADATQGTQVTVRIEADPGVRTATTEVRVRVYGDTAASAVPTSLRSDQRYSLGDGAFDADTIPGEWPLVLAIAPANGDASRTYALFAEALDGEGASVGTVRIVGGYASGANLAVSLRLEDACRDVLCTPEETCRRGVCVDAQMDPDTLPIACPAGEAEYGGECVAIEACGTTTTCGDHSTCAAEAGGFLCLCDPGYLRAGLECVAPGRVDAGVVSCPALAAPANGSVDLTTAGVPTNVATYSCNGGSSITGNGGLATRTCQTNGTWTGSAPTCMASLCSPSLTAPTNGTVDRTTGATEDVATYGCDLGYTISGGSTRTCQVTGTWSGVAPTCTANSCAPNLNAPANGTVDRTTGMTGTVATYACNMGYSINGSATRACLTNGTWAGAAPTCSANACAPNLVTPTNGSLDRTMGVTGDVATYSCDSGYNLSGNGGSNTRTCQVDAAWSGTSPTCEVSTGGPPWPLPNTPPYPFDYSPTASTVVDNVTTLEWQRTVDSGLYSQVAAATYCGGLSLDGKFDWRLPTRIELASIVDFGRVSPSIDPTAFPSTPLARFWSSTPYPGSEGWSVNFEFGTMNEIATSTMCRARCVRGSAAPPPGPLVASGPAPNDVVTDPYTGLIWQRTISPASFTQAAAITYCSGVGGGYRLPTVLELLSIVDDTRTGPAIDTTAFASAPAELFWSSTPYAGGGGNGWFVNFGRGPSSMNNDTNPYRVRCVR